MKQNRRSFIKKTAASVALAAVSPFSFGRNILSNSFEFQSKPWIELSKAAYLHNASQINKMAGGKPVIAVLKNNAYGLGDVQVAKILDNSEHIAAIANVKDGRSIAMRNEGVSKPILLMGDFDSANAKTLVEKEITLSVFSKDSFKKINVLANEAAQSINVALYIDTGLGRMGVRNF